LDVGGVFAKAADYPDNLAWALSPYNRGGRYFPAYWLYNFLAFGLFSTNIAAHFAVQVTLFVLALGLTSALFLRLTNRPMATAAFGFIACLGGAVAESMYTLGKAEPLAYLCIVGVLVLFQSADWMRPSRWLPRLVAIAVLASVAMWFKETSLVLLTFCPAAMLADLYIGGHRIASIRRSTVFLRYARTFTAIAAGIVLSKLPYLLFSGQGDSAYLAYDIDAVLVADNLVFYMEQQPDVLFFGIAALVLCFGSAVRMKRVGALPGNRENLVFVIGILAMAWGYYAGLLIWRWPMGYYMLLPSIAFKFAAIYGVLLVGDQRIVGARGLRVAYGLALASIFYGALHSLYVATSQISYSRMYTEAVSRYLAEAGPSGRLIFESFAF
jgi:hypothetical protein